MAWVVTEYPAMQHLLDAGLRSTLALPIYVQDEPIAFFALNSTDPQAYTAEDAETLERVVAQVSGVLANARLRTELREEIGRRIALAEIGRQVGSSPEVSDMFQTLEHLVKGLIDFDRFAVTTVDTELAQFRPEYISGGGCSRLRCGS